MAKVYNGSAVCRFGEGSSELQDSRTVKLEGVGKYPHVVVKLARGQARKQPDPKLEVQPELGGEGWEIESGSSDVSGEVLVDFGSVAVGSVAERWIEIVNVSPVSIVDVIIYVIGFEKRAHFVPKHHFQYGFK